MFSERLQILVSPDQRRLLGAEAERRGASVASVIREAVTAHLGSVPRGDRLQAVEELSAMEGRFLTPEELDEVTSAERDEEADRLLATISR